MFSDGSPRSDACSIGYRRLAGAHSVAARTDLAVRVSGRLAKVFFSISFLQKERRKLFQLAPANLMIVESRSKPRPTSPASAPLPLPSGPARPEYHNS